VTNGWCGADPQSPEDLPGGGEGAGGAAEAHEAAAHQLGLGRGIEEPLQPACPITAGDSALPSTSSF
jgi:hypothetical protein